jgi:hypothetical protein
MTPGTQRSKQLRKKARLWKILGVLAFIVGAVLVWGRISYNLHDFYAENYERLSAATVEKYDATDAQIRALIKAQDLMEQDAFWDATTQLEAVKQDSTAALQLSDWNKILCMIGLEEKEKAIALLLYYMEQPGFSYKREEAKELLELY